MSRNITGEPSNLEEAIETLLVYYGDDIPIIRKRSEEEFLALAHFGGGMFIRNSWCLFWNKENRHPAWPVEKPPLVQWFNDRGIVDADEMSSQVLRALWNKARR